MNFPNYITLFRIMLCPFFFTALVSYDRGDETYRLLALGLVMLAVSTDALDGFLARALKQQTKLGHLLDPLADKLLLLSGYLGLLYVDTFQYRPPLWITVTIVFRDMFLIAGMLVIFFVSGQLRIQPNWLGKITTFLQMVTLVVILLQWPVSVFFYYATAFATIVSCGAYLRRETKLLKNQSPHSQSLT